jgi:arginase
MGPSAIRIAGVAARVAALGRIVEDMGDLPAPIPETQPPADPRKKYVREIAHVCRQVYDRSRRSLEAGALPILLGGDHSLAAGSVAASADWVARTTSRPLGLLWLDAHGDMNTPESTSSGNVHGMPLAALLGNNPSELASIGSSPSVLAQHTVLIGIRNLDEREKTRVRESGVHVFTMKDIDREGIAAIADQAIALATAGTGGLHVSFDMDVCDPSIAPGVGTPVNGGFNYREAHLMMELIADSGRLLALDLVEANPTLDVRNATALLATELALSGLGQNIL